MVKIFYYELRRLLGNRFTVGLLLVALLYGYWTMRGEILLGIANTAPFSPWSFGAYLAEMMPLLLVALLCFLSILTSDTGKRVEVLIAATPLSQAVHCRIRYTAVTVAFLVVTAVPVVYAVGFYGIIFGAIDWNTLLLPLVITVFPPFLLVMGTGLWLGRVHHRLLMALVAVVLLLAVVPVPSGPLWRNFLFLLSGFPGGPGPALSAAGLCDRRKSDGLCLGSGVRCRRGPVKRVSEQDSRRCPARCETRNFNQWPEGVPRCSAFPGFENREQE